MNMLPKPDFFMSRDHWAAPVFPLLQRNNPFLKMMFVGVIQFI